MTPATILMTPAAQHWASRAPAVDSSGSNYRDAVGGVPTAITAQTIVDYASSLWEEVRTLIFLTA
jgi:hypothetical protein